MMTLAQFRARTSAGRSPKRKNVYIQQLDSLLALYEHMDASMTEEERLTLSERIHSIADDFLDSTRKRLVPSTKRAGVTSLFDDSQEEMRRLSAAIRKRREQQKLLEEQAAQVAAQQAAQVAAQQAAQQAEERARAARERWRAAMAKVNLIVGAGQQSDVPLKPLFPGVWPELFDPKHRSGLTLADPFESWQHANTKKPFEVWLEQDFLPKHTGDPDLQKGVKYLSPEERTEFEVKIIGGQFRWAESGALVHTGSMSTHFSGPGHAIWVCSPDRRLYTWNHQVGEFHHSSFLSGGPVMGAGEWSISQGRLVMISNKTGHYRAGFQELFRVMLRLSVLGVDMKSVIVYWPWPDNHQRKYYRASDFMAGRPAERFQQPRNQQGKPLQTVPPPPLPPPLPT